MLSLRVARAAEAFWRDNPSVAAFPRDMAAAVPWALPVCIVQLPRLRAPVVRRWLVSARGGATLAETVPGDDRPLCGCLSTFAGNGYIFVNSSDPPDEIRFTIAHEAAHFMWDYAEPRERSRAVLGDGVLDLFEGMRRPHADERVAALLAEVDLEKRTRLFARDHAGGSLCAATGEAEQAADRLALELLAPAEHVLAGWQGAPDQPLWDSPAAGLAERLERVYGLLAGAAGVYARQLLAAGGARSFDTWLGGPVKRGVE